MNRQRLLSAAGWAAAILLLVVAVVTLARRHDEITSALSMLRQPDPISIALICACVAGGLPLISEAFRQLTNRRGNVESLEMLAVISAASLANWLPLRAGLIGRAAYHKAVNDLSVRWTLRVLLETVGLAVLGVGVALGAVIIALALAWPVAAAVGAPLAIAAAVATRTTLRPWAVAWACRYGDLLLIAARYWLIFRLLGAEIGMDVAVVLAAASMLVGMLPLPSGGLGVREWVIGGMSLALAPLPNAAAMGLLADLVNRAIELLVIAPAGVAGIAAVRRRLRSAG